MRPALTLTAVVFAAARAHADQTLLGAIEHTYSYWNANSNGNFLMSAGGFSREWNTSEVGQTFDLEPRPTLLEGLSAWSFDQFASAGGCSLTTLQCFTQAGAPMSATRFVPPLADYGLTRIAQTLDAASVEKYSDSPQRWRGTATQTIRFYGVPVPEPNSLLLAHLSMLYLASTSRFPGSRRFRR